MITAEDLNFKIVRSQSTSTEHSLMYFDRAKNIKKEVISKGRRVGGMFRAKKTKIYYYRDEKGSTVHESMAELLKELNT